MLHNLQHELPILPNELRTKFILCSFFDNFIGRVGRCQKVTKRVLISTLQEMHGLREKQVVSGKWQVVSGEWYKPGLG